MISELVSKVDDFGEKYLLIKRTSKRDAFWFRLSHFADHSVIWFILAFVRSVLLLDWRDLLRFVVVMAAESGLTNGSIKLILKKRRPYEVEGTFEPGKPLPYGLRRPITSAFPSGHATAAMTGACLLSSGYPLVAIFAFPLGIAVAYSRMYTRMHHFSDVLAGLVLGLVYGYLATRFLDISNLGFI